MRKAVSIREIWDSVAGGSVDLAGLRSLSDDDVIVRLTVLNGVGIWTAGMLFIFSLERRDVVSFSDFAIRQGMMRLYDKETLDRASFDRDRNQYSPNGSVASLYLWEVSHRWVV